LIEELYPKALESGISPLSFWELTLGEVVQMINAYQRKREIYNKDIAIQQSFLSNQLLIGIHNMLGQKENAIDTLQLWDYFPELFAEEKIIYDKYQKENQQYEMAESRYSYAERYNEILKKKGDDD